MKEKNKNKFWLIAIIYLLGLFMGAIDTGILTPARTIIQNDLQVDDKLGIWMITIYTLAYAASIPIMGKLADKFGRKYIYLIAIFLFGTGSLLCGLSEHYESFPLLLIARVIQAIGGGGIVPIATAEFGTSFPVEKRGLALGLVGAVYGIANVFGSSAGSLILDIFGNNNWQYIFYINIPITIFILLLGFFKLKNNKTDNNSKLDYPGIVILVTMILSLLYGLTNVDFFNFYESFKESNVYPYITVFLILLPLFIVVEKKTQDPIINLDYFTNKRILLTLIISFISGVILMGTIFIPQFSENAVKIATGSGGYFVIILGLFAGVGAPLSGKLIDKYGPKSILLLGFGISVIGSLFLILVAANYPNLLTVIISLILLGLGLGFTVGAPLNYMMLENTKKEEATSALASLSLIRSIGTTIAPAILVGFLANSITTLPAKEIAILPNEINVPKLPYAEELNNKINEYKTNENMAKIEFPNINTNTKIEIKIDIEGDSKLPDNLITLFKTADVTNIAERVKTIAKTMFVEKTDPVILNIQESVTKVINSINEVIKELDKTIIELNTTVNGINIGIEQMRKVINELNTNISNNIKTIASQTNVINHYYNIYNIIKTKDDSSISSIIELLNEAEKASIPNYILIKIEDLKSINDLKTKIEYIKNNNNYLNNIVNTLSSQKENTNNKINQDINKRDELLKTINTLELTKTDLYDTISMMTVLGSSVPNVFEEAKNDYLDKVDKLGPKIEGEFQTTLNEGFKHVYLAVVIATIFGLLMLLFYQKRNK